MYCWLLLAGALGLAPIAPGSLTAAQSGALTQLPGRAGCLQDAGAKTPVDCVSGNALDTAAGVTVSRDGKNVCVASFGSDAVAVFARDRRSGVLTQLAGSDACVQDVGAEAPADCADGFALAGAVDVAVVVFAREDKTDETRDD